MDAKLSLSSELDWIDFENEKQFLCVVLFLFFNILGSIIFENEIPKGNFE